MFIKTSQLLEHCVNRRTMKPVTLAENRVERTNVYKHIEIYKWVTQMTFVHSQILQPPRVLLAITRLLSSTTDQKL